MTAPAPAPASAQSGAQSGTAPDCGYLKNPEKPQGTLARHREDVARATATVASELAVSGDLALVPPSEIPRRNYIDEILFARMERDNVQSAPLCTDNDEHHRFAFTWLPDSEPDDGGVRACGDAGVHHLAYTYANLGDLLETYARLKQSGVTPYWPIRRQPSRNP